MGELELDSGGRVEADQEEEGGQGHRHGHVQWSGGIWGKQLDLLTENGAVLKTAQNTFNIEWRRLPVALGL